MALRSDMPPDERSRGSEVPGFPRDSNRLQTGDAGGTRIPARPTE